MGSSQRGPLWVWFRLRRMCRACCELPTIRGLWRRKQKHLWSWNTVRKEALSLPLAFIHALSNPMRHHCRWRGRKKRKHRVSWVTTSQGETESSSSSLISDWFFYLGNEPRLLGWTPDFLRCWIKWYPEFLSDSQLLLSISYLFGHVFLLCISKETTQRSQEKVPWHRRGSHTKKSKGWIWPNHPVVFLYFQVEQAYVSSSALYAINISLPLCPDVFLLLTFV